MNRTVLVGPLLQSFFSEHLAQHRQVSSQTIASYRDTFRLLLQFIRDKKGIEPAVLPLDALSAPAILDFLEGLEQQRGNCIRSRNVRLTAIRSFFRVVALREPSCLGIATQVLAIPVKRSDKPLVGYVTRAELDSILAGLDRQTWLGRRDHALLLTMFNTGARVSEMTALRREQIILSPKPFVHLEGKGRKQRMVPLWQHTAKVLRDWFKEAAPRPEGRAFPNRRGHPLTRFGVTHLLREAVQTAASKCPGLAVKRISPHTFRHGTAMALLQSGVDVAVIALWLGHESTETTHKYIEADLAMKEKALATLTPPEDKCPRRFRADDKLLAFLADL
jgi:site-specific recombinase XerD